MPQTIGIDQGGTRKIHAIIDEHGLPFSDVVVETRAMHIADGFISQSACVITTGIAAVSLGWAINQVRKTTTPDQLKLAPAVAATVFAGQMVNFAVGTEMSGHLVGSALATILLGPALTMLIMAAVLAAQCAFLGDGGITALGANFLSMGVVGVFAASVVWNRLRQTASDLTAAGIAAWISVVAGSIVCAAALATPGVAFGMIANHSVIGLAEAGITVGLLVGVRALSSLRSQIAALLGAALAFVLVTPIASTLPDGMEAAIEGTAYSVAGILTAIPLALIALRALRQSNRRKPARVRQ